MALSVPAQAATFSGVNVGIRFDNFSHPALSTETNAFTDTLAISSGGSVLALSDAEAVFISGLEAGTETTASNFIVSHAAGSGGNYFGLAQSEASLVGNFALAAQETFSFSFDGFLGLATAVDNATYESAFALGFLGFSVLGNSGHADSPSLLLDQLGLLATLDTPGTQDVFDTNLFALFLAGDTGNIVINSLNLERQTGGLEEFRYVEFSGRYSRTFDEDTLVSLVETKAGVAEVQQVPAPSLLWGLMAYGGLGVFGKLRRRLTSVYAMVTASDKYTS
ncbi:MAG: hypothetical protein DCF21_04715 [Leptolyngbya sp.]|nr:MAG: hypothetical protein DCF21_04715 [Leptolyngbya sp.]